MQRFLALIGLLAIVAAIAAGVFFFGGYYSVAAIQAEPELIAAILKRVRVASIEQHATDRPPANINDPQSIQAGARAFSSRGCATCHGAPGVEWAKFSEAVRPDPPDLNEVAKALSVPQIFWVVKNGVNMTAMPGFALIDAPDAELWNIAAFVKKLPEVPEADYKAWTSAAP